MNRIKVPHIDTIEQSVCLFQTKPFQFVKRLIEDQTTYPIDILCCYIKGQSSTAILILFHHTRRPFPLRGPRGMAAVRPSLRSRVIVLASGSVRGVYDGRVQPPWRHSHSGHQSCIQVETIPLSPPSSNLRTP